MSIYSGAALQMKGSRIFNANVIEFAKIKPQDRFRKISQSVNFFSFLAAQINVILGRSVPLFGIRRGIWQENRQSLAAIANKREAYQRPSCALWCWGHCSKSLKFRCISIYILI